MKRLCLMICVFGLTVSAGDTSLMRTISDDFEDGVIDTSLWIVGGGGRGWRADDPIGAGDWDYSHEEFIDPTDGYLRTRVWGPPSGLTYGGEAWVCTVQNFNDGKNYVINFTWEPEFLDYHSNWYYIQITDGYIPERADYHWLNRWPPLPPVTEADLAGTYNLLWHTDPVNGPIRGLNFENSPSIGKVSWSIAIDEAGVARLYDGPDTTGSLLHEATLDLSYPWYVRWIVSDGTSSGFPGGDARLKLYDYSALCGPADIAAARIQASIAEKDDALGRIDAALEIEWAAYEALEELLESEDYGDLKKGDIVAAKQKIHSAIQHQEQSKKALEKSIEKLEDSLALLGWPVSPKTNQRR